MTMENSWIPHSVTYVMLLDLMIYRSLKDFLSHCFFMTKFNVDFIWWCFQLMQSIVSIMEKGLEQIVFAKIVWRTKMGEQFLDTFL